MRRMRIKHPSLWRSTMAQRIFKRYKFMLCAILVQLLVQESPEKTFGSKRNDLTLFPGQAITPQKLCPYFLYSNYSQNNFQEYKRFHSLVLLYNYFLYPHVHTLYSSFSLLPITGTTFCIKNAYVIVIMRSLANEIEYN